MNTKNRTNAEDSLSKFNNSSYQNQAPTIQNQTVSQFERGPVTKESKSTHFSKITGNERLREDIEKEIKECKRKLR